MKSKIVFIGAGRIAYSMVPAFLEKEYPVIQIISKNLSSAKALAEKYGIKEFTSSIENLSDKSELIFLSIPDDQIKPIAESLQKNFIDLSGKKIVHFSGAENIRILDKLKEAGASTAGFHIMQTFPNREPVNFRNNYAVIECEDNKLKKELIEIAENINLIPIDISSDKKIFYHLIGVFASNFLVSNFIAIEKLMESTGIEKNKMMNILEPIVNSTLNNLKKNNPADALSGVIKRRDLETIKKHIRALEDKEDILRIYISSQLNLTASELEKSPNDEKLKSINRYLLEIEKKNHSR